MKNTHIFSTDKPTFLHKSTKTGILRKSSACINDMKQAQGMNIYITSDEEIKEGDWILDTVNDIIEKVKFISKGKLINGCWVLKSCKKIILTTDQDLIADGVQAIDDEFLEWFVQNPSCEVVEVQKWFDGLDFLEYKIIIPKEEPKQKLPIVNGSYGCTIETEKQETLEEVNTSSLENLLENNYDFNVQFHQLKRESIFSFAVAIYGESLSFKEWQEKHYGKYIEISKWQQERSYSEEEVIKLLIYCKNIFGGSGLEDYHHDDEVKEWFEQVKNK
jgi:hypothetical protein